MVIFHRVGVPFFINWSLERGGRCRRAKRFVREDGLDGRTVDRVSSIPSVRLGLVIVKASFFVGMKSVENFV